MDEKEKETLTKILEELQFQGKRKKDIWDRFSTISTFLSTVVIATLGLYLSNSFNEHQGIRDHQAQMHQARILEMQTVEKFIPHLTSDEKTKEIALLTLTSLGSPEFATKFAQLSPSEGSDAATDRIMRTAAAPEQSQIPSPVKATAGTEKEGWAYIGHFVESKSSWKTRYFEIDQKVDPVSLEGKTLVVREETGALNVREGMPTLTGTFRPVIGALKPGSKAKILKVREWLSSGYMWAHIAYGT